jgi:hypothetical protein
MKPGLSKSGPTKPGPSKPEPSKSGPAKSGLPESPAYVFRYWTAAEYYIIENRKIM